MAASRRSGRATRELRRGRRALRRARLRQQLGEHPAQQAHVAAVGRTLHPLDQARVAVQSQNTTHTVSTSWSRFGGLKDASRKARMRARGESAARSTAACRPPTSSLLKCRYAAAMSLVLLGSDD